MNDLRELLARVRTIAVVGLSANPSRPSNDVFAFMVSRGFDCVGVNPGLAGTRIHGAPVFASLAAIDRAIDMVDIFRTADAVHGLIDEALALAPQPRIIWTQPGVIDEAAKTYGEAAGLRVVMNRCPKIELSRA